jgi:short-subunit dehydrogenase
MIIYNLIIMDFHKKVVLITGATGGIGKALAYQLASEECTLILLGRNETKLQQLANELKEKKIQCMIQKCDVQKKEEVKNVMNIVQKQYQQIDIAILTAGILTPNPIETFDSTIIKESMESNFFGYVYCIEALLPIMKHQKSGTIAAVSTLPDRRGVPGWGAYGASKAAISWLLESLRAEAKQKYNINIITIKPGSVQTPMIEGFPRRGALSPEAAAAIILKGIKKEKKIIQFPLFQVLLVRIADLFPNLIYDRIPIEQQKGEGYPETKEKNEP